MEAPLEGRSSKKVTMTDANVVRINIAKQFTKMPGGRYIRLGPFSGELFRNKFLEPHLREGKTVIVELDGVRGYGSSFLEEAFGGTVRELNLEIADALQRILIVSSVESWKLDVEDYIRNAK